MGRAADDPLRERGGGHVASKLACADEMPTEAEVEALLVDA